MDGAMTWTGRIAHLIDAPQAAPVLTRWFVEEWTPWYGPAGPGDAHADLAACAGRDALPICLVALSDGDDVLGAVALRAESVGSERGDGPWLAGLLVGEAHRGQGIGAALIEAIEGEAWRLGFPAIHVSTNILGSHLQRHGWRAIATAASLRGEVDVYVKTAP